MYRGVAVVVKQDVPYEPPHWAKDFRPVRAGLEGGQFKPLDAEAVKSIDATVYQILEEIGLSQAPVSGIEYMTGAGAVLGMMAGSGFPAHWSKIRCPNVLVISPYGQNSKHDLMLSGSRVHYGTAGAAVHVVDVEKNEYRLILLIFTTLHVLWITWITSIFFSVQWLLETSSTPQTLISMFMRRSKALPNTLVAVL